MNEWTMNEWIMVLLSFIAIPILFGYLTMRFAAQKGRDTGGEKFGWFLLGFFFPIIGMIIALVISPKASTAPPPPPA